MTVRVRMEEEEKILIGPSRNTPANRNLPCNTDDCEGENGGGAEDPDWSSYNTPANRNLPTQMTVRVRMEEVEKILIGPPTIH